MESGEQVHVHILWVCGLHPSTMVCLSVLLGEGARYIVYWEMFQELAGHKDLLFLGCLSHWTKSGILGHVMQHEICILHDREERGYLLHHV